MGINTSNSNRKEYGAGLVMLVLLVTLVGAILFAVSSLRRANSRVYKFTDETGTVQYVDSLDKVPVDQRAQAQAAPESGRITKADFQEFAEQVRESAKR